MVMNDIIAKLKSSSKIAVSFHSSPDGDSIGSALALMIGLKKLNKYVYIVSKEPVPDYLNFLPESSEITGENLTLKDDTDCMVVLDCGDLKRVNGNINIANRKFCLINIDHHLSNDLYGDLNFVDTNAAAVGEIVYGLLKSMGITVDRSISECLYTSLITDTGSFKYSGTTSVTHTIAGDLINSGIDFSKIHRIVFENIEFKRLKLIGKAIENMDIINRGNICIITITSDMLRETESEDISDTSDIIALGMQIKTVETAALLKEVRNGIKISLRSKNVVDVRKVAELFGGGGHKRAAGLFIEGKSIQECKSIIEEKLEEELI